MSTNRQTRINQFLDEHKPGTVCLASWLEEQGISYDLQKRYRGSGWLESIGKGAFKRPKVSFPLFKWLKYCAKTGMNL
jgi:hypothetical protein